MTTISSKINLNLPQTPREINPEINLALIPVYNAIRLLQQYLQEGDNTSVANTTNLTQLQALLSAHIGDTSIHPDIANLNYTKIYYTDQVFSGPLAGSIGEIGDFGVNKTTRDVYYKDQIEGWIKVGSLAAPTTSPTSSPDAYLAWRGTWLSNATYLKNSVVTVSDGSVYVALSNRPAGSPVPPSPDWKLLQEGTVSSSNQVGEAVLSSRAPAVDPAPPNFVISRLGDLVYARLAT